jgi:hypothetical protein
MATEWSEWRPFPDPRKAGVLAAPFGSGCYELRHRDGRLVLFGTGGHLAYRMSSILPEPFGTGHRSNSGKRAYVLEHLEDIEYRTCTFVTPQDAKDCERELKANHTYIFPT